MEKFEIQKLLCAHYIENVPTNCFKKIIYVLDGDGLWEIRKSQLAVFTTLLHRFSIPGLKSGIREDGFELNIPKIPISFFETIVSFFKKIYEKNSSEVFVQCFYDFDKKDFILFCPEQRVGFASIKYDRDLEFEKDKVLAFEVHSHASMSAFFSGTDDGDEKADGFFGVVGKLDKFYPEVIFSYVAGGVRKQINIDNIFEINNNEFFPKEWIEKVKKEKRIRKVRKEVDDDICFEEDFGKMMKRYQMGLFENDE
jgi:PRTRC genetic system protein A